MTMTGGALALLLAGSAKNTSRALTDDDPGMATQPRRADACPPNSNSCTVPTATIRHALRALASESRRGERLNRVRLLRPLVAQAHDILRERFESGGSAEAYLRDRARLADSVVIGLLHIASMSSGIRDGNTAAPRAVATSTAVVNVSTSTITTTCAREATSRSPALPHSHLTLNSL